MASESADATLPAELTLVQASAAGRALQAALEQAAARGALRLFTLDAAPLRQLDSAALAVLLDLHRSARARGAQVQIRHAPPKLAQLANLYGVAELLGLAAAQASASA